MVIEQLYVRAKNMILHENMALEVGRKLDIASLTGKEKTHNHQTHKIAQFVNLIYIVKWTCHSLRTTAESELF